MCDTHLTDLTTAAAALWLGVNLSGAEFGAVTPENPGRHGEDYVYPAAAYVGDRYSEAAELVAQGVTMFRLPFRWERLQPELAGPLNADELARLAHDTAEMLRGLGGAGGARSAQLWTLPGALSSTAVGRGRRIVRRSQTSGGGWRTHSPPTRA